MLQFFKKTGRKRNDKLSQIIDDQFVGNVDELLLESEQFCVDNVDIDSNTSNPTFSKSILQIVTDKNCLSYFVQFMDSKKSLPPIKFWLDAESFKTAAEVDVSNDSNIAEEVNDDNMSSNEQVDCTKLIPTSNMSSDVPDCVPILPKSISNETFNDLKQTQSMTELNENDMTKPLTDDEKSQLYEQNIVKQNLKNKQESLHIEEQERNRQLELENQQKLKRINFQSSIASDAIRIFRKYLTTESSHHIEVPATIVNEISLALCSDQCLLLGNIFHNFH